MSDDQKLDKQFEEASRILDDLLSKFQLPEAFSKFNVEKEVEFFEGLKMSFRVPGALDNEWATFTATLNSTEGSFIYSYVPRILAATLTRINGTPLADLIGSPSLKIKLNGQVFPQLAVPDRHELYQLVLENIVGNIPYDVLKIVYDAELEKWFVSAAGIIEDEVPAPQGPESGPESGPTLTPFEQSDEPMQLPGSNLPSMDEDHPQS